MKTLQSLPWIEPLAMASAVDAPYWVLLYSGVQASYSGRFSLLALDLAESVSGKDFVSLAGRLSCDRPRFDNAWFGYFGYGLKNSLEELATDQEYWLSLPALQWMRFNTIIEFDHINRSVQVYSEHDNPLIPAAHNQHTTVLPPVSGLKSNMSRETYLRNAATIIDSIHRGDLYQANLTRKFEGAFAAEPKHFDVFSLLCQKSPAPYSAFMHLDSISIASSSPELFLSIGADGKVKTRPIKGTSPRFPDAKTDQQSLKKLAGSPKDRAENLMIVDLMRNDLSRTCIPGSIGVESLFEVTSHTAVHHMSSTITGQKHPQCTTLDVIRHCFPPGSMTGAPKIRAMNLCSALETLDRGIYSGAIGWLGGDGSCELSVVIRTLILQGERFEFQVGGGIVADSTPEAELMELIDKSKGIAKCLGISPDDLAL